MTKAIWEGAVLAESDQCVEVEGNQYFPPDAVKTEHFKPSATTRCVPGKAPRVTTMSKSAASATLTPPGYYPDPKPAAKQITGYVAFWKGVKVER